MASCGGIGAYSNHVTLTQHVFYGQTTPMSFQILLALGSQTLGFSIAGFLRQFVVWPSSMIWPNTLADCTFLNAIHKNYGKHNPGHMTHERFFCIAMAASFVWYWFPSYLFTGLSMFNWVCWIAPKNVVINALFGTNTGLGMSFLTFDWEIISYFGSPLITPVGHILWCFLYSLLMQSHSQWWSQMNIGVAFLLVFWVIAPILYCKSACQ
jgi:hypothetical protein